MSVSGWIKLHRTIDDHWIFNFKEPDKGLAWINLLTMANHADNEFYIKGKLIKCKRGQVAMSQVSLQKKWHMSQNKLKRFLILLKNESMIDFETNDLTTIITICNYSYYQGYEQDSVESTYTLTDNQSFPNILKKVSFHDSKMNDHESHASNCNYSINQGGERAGERAVERAVERTTNEQSNDKQECKNEKNEKNIDIGAVAPIGKKTQKFEIPTISEIKQHIEMLGYSVNAEAFHAHYSSNGWMVGKNKMKCWKSALVTWDKRAGNNNQKSFQEQERERIRKRDEAMNSMDF